jgi:CPA2 family monovalent cation:H+ antiporter-2
MREEFALLEDFAIIMAVAGAALLLFRRLHLSPILGYLVAGVIVGPYTGQAIIVRDITTVRLLADLGLVLLLFAIGLEFGWERLRHIGVRVAVIGIMEITVMVALGYEIGIALGWTGTEAVFLGAAMAISSSAILAKVLADTGQLRGTHGQLIVGILVVEDIAAVVLLSILSGVATTGVAGLSDVGFLAAKLAIFSAAALVLGGLAAPRLIGFVARAESRETLLITGLALCFGLALVAAELGLSAAAGAFLIGAVLGDTEHSEELTRTMGPVKDMFAALFFVSIGMLVDISLFRQFAMPALVVTAVFVAGKVIANTIGAFLVGNSGHTSLRVGTGMPQMGEFSLAIAKVGVENAAIGPFFYPVIVATTAVSTLLHPLIFRSSDAIAARVERLSPGWLQRYVVSLAGWLGALQNLWRTQSPLAGVLRRATQAVLINVGIILVLLGIGTVAVRFSQQIGERFGLSQDIVGLIVGGSTLALCLPSAVAIWRALRFLTHGLSLYMTRLLGPNARLTGSTNLEGAIREGLVLVLALLIVLWSLPLVSSLLSLGKMATPVPIVFLVVLTALIARTAFRIHVVLERAFSRTFLGERGEKPPRKPPDCP